MDQYWLEVDFFQEVDDVIGIFHVFLHCRKFFEFGQGFYIPSMCFTVYGFPHEHFCGSFCLSMKEWYERVSEIHVASA